MTPADAYLEDVRRSMRGMDARVRDDILRELRSHLAESAAANGGDVGRSVAGMGPARDVGRGYRALYGYGLGFQVLFLLVTAALAVFTVPVIESTDLGTFPSVLSLPVLAVLAAWLLWVGSAAGSRVGLFAGLVAFLARLVVAGAVAAANPGAGVLPGGAAFFAIGSVLLVLLGWLPGTAKKVWTKPGAEL